MNPTPEKPTLKKARQAAAKKVARVSGVKDFISKEQRQELALARERGKKKPAFGKVDAFTAEIVARFGFEVYKAWNRGEISPQKMNAWISAERVREKAVRLETLNILVAAVAGANNPDKNGHTPKSLKAATKNLKKISNEIKEASR